MIPTNELRFVEREVRKEVPSHEYLVDSTGSRVYVTVAKYRVLQQKWEESYSGKDESGNSYSIFEWRDVPLEKE